LNAHQIHVPYISFGRSYNLLAPHQRAAPDIFTVATALSHDGTFTLESVVDRRLPSQVN
jgi:hypothetical protein